MDNKRVVSEFDRLGKMDNKRVVKMADESGRDGGMHLVIDFPKLTALSIRVLRDEIMSRSINSV